jgi:hypothetical protein
MTQLFFKIFVSYFAKDTQSFLDFVSHFLVFIARYSDSVIFDSMTQSFLDFISYFLKFYHALSHFFDSLTIF